MKKEEIIEAVREHPWEISLFDDNDEDLQLAAVEENSFSIRYIQNPTNKVQIKAVDDMHSSFVYIMKPCQEAIDIIKSGWSADKYVIPRNISPNLEFSFYEPVYTNMEQIMFHLGCYINDEVKFFQYKSLRAAMNFLLKRKNWCFENGSRACYIDIRKIDFSNIESDIIELLRERPDMACQHYREFNHGACIEGNYYLSMACGVEFCPDGHADYLVFEYEGQLYIITILCFE